MVKCTVIMGQFIIYLVHKFSDGVFGFLAVFQIFKIYVNLRFAVFLKFFKCYTKLLLCKLAGFCKENENTHITVKNKLFINSVLCSVPTNVIIHIFTKVWFYLNIVILFKYLPACFINEVFNLHSFDFELCYR